MKEIQDHELFEQCLAEYQENSYMYREYGPTDEIISKAFAINRMMRSIAEDYGCELDDVAKALAEA